MRNLNALLIHLYDLLETLLHNIILGSVYNCLLLVQLLFIYSLAGLLIK